MALASSLGMPVASATDGAANNGYGYTQYADYYPDDAYKVCDQAKDSMSAVGWIEVRRRDGSWLKYPTIKATRGRGTCTGWKDVTIARESAQVKVVNCRQNGSAGGPIRDCDRRTVSGA